MSQGGPTVTPAPPKTVPLTSLGFSLPASTPSSSKRPVSNQSFRTPHKPINSTPTRLDSVKHELTSTPRGFRPMSEQMPMGSPFLSSPGPSRTKRPLSEGSSARGEPEVKKEVSMQRSIVDTSRILEVGVVHRVKGEDEGIGVSPRKGKVTKRSNGKECVGRLGSRSRLRVRSSLPSAQLASLIKSSDASRVLFFSSLNNALHPTLRLSSHSSPHRSATSLAKASPAMPSKVSPIKHLRASADIRLRPLEAMRGPTHQCCIFHCEVIKWTQPSQRHMAPRLNTARVDGMIDPVVPALGAEVMIVIHPLSSECPKVGIDGRVLVQRLLPDSRADQSSKLYEIGVWWPWSASVTPRPPDSAHEEIGQSSEVRQDEQDELDPSPHQDPSRTITTVFATRYLIAEVP